MNISSFFRIHPKKNEHDKEIDKKKEKRKSRRLDKHAGDTSNDAVSEKHVATSIHKADSTKAASSHPKNTGSPNSSRPIPENPISIYIYNIINNSVMYSHSVV